MKVVTSKKKNEEIMTLVEHYARIFIVGCGTCPTVCKTGGIEQTAEMEEMLAASGKLVTGRIVLPAVCDAAPRLLLEQAGNGVEAAQAILVMSCGLGVRNVASWGLKPALPALDSLFFGYETGPGIYEEVCSQCGECVLAWTGGICPVTSCHKGILNGPCGGTKDGMCEVGGDRPCAWTQVYERLEKTGNLDLMRRYMPPRNWGSHLKPGRWRIEAAAPSSSKVVDRGVKEMGG